MVLFVNSQGGHILKVLVYNTYWQLGRHYGRQYASRKQGNALAN